MLAWLSGVCPCPGQSASDLIRAGSGDREIARQFEGLLQSETEDFGRWIEGWGLAASMGTTVLPVLQELTASRSNPLDRSILVAACGLAEGRSGDGYLREVAGDSSARKHDRVIALLTLAMGPVRPGAELSLQDLLGRSRSATRDDVLLVAGLLALHRYSAASAPKGLRYGDRQDAGIVAAAQLCAPREPGRTWRSERSPHRDLVLRAFLLGTRDGGSSPAQVELALELLADGETEARLRRAAAVCVARSGEESLPRQVLDQAQTAQVLAILSGNPVLRETLFAAKRLGAVPSRLLPPEDRARIAVSWVLAAPLSEVLEEAPVWGRNEAVAPAICFALAFRLYRDGDRLAPERLQRLPSGIAEAEWVRCASGGSPGSQGPRFTHSRLDSAYALARAGRLPPSAAMRTVEGALWHRGWHPGAATREAEHDLIGDLLIAGSNVGQNKMARRLQGRRAYLPNGIHAADDRFYELAFEFFRFMRRPGWTVPEAALLR